MVAEVAELRPRARLLLLAVAAACALLAALVASRDSLPAPGWLANWSATHPDPRAFSSEEVATLGRVLDGQRRDDALLLLAGLAAGCLAVAARPALARAAGGWATAVLAAGSVALGLWAAGDSLHEQWQEAGEGRWTLGDDSLPALAGPYAAPLRELRVPIGMDDAVLLVGTNQQLFNAAAWALAPRAVFPVLRNVPDEMSVDEVRVLAQSLTQGKGFPRRWLLDLRALERGAAAERPALIEVDP